MFVHNLFACCLDLSTVCSLRELANKKMGFHGIQDTESQGKQFEQWPNNPNKTYAYQGAQLDAAACSQIEAAVRGGGLHHAQPLKQAHVGAGAGEAAHTGHSPACFASQKSQLWDAYAKAVNAKKAAMAPDQVLTRPIDISQRDVGPKAFGCDRSYE
ncbi:hypothetical protein N3K66_008323 [Trichothecium roseum]|uniref:Uncharacterized protein n=1 Tax=Trichothecium roseum TaxID=47278 RepID=A0ACC0UUG9_9HYPO|nr:hypothetical protein N3K66_008323 [Trichothecium roseum]